MITEERIQIDDSYVNDLGSRFGAVATFVGVVRDHNKGKTVTGIFYDCYREMAVNKLTGIIEEIEARLPVKIMRLLHRVGEVGVGETSLLVVVASAHRREAFKGCEEVVEAIKHQVPIWKKERYDDDAAAWL